jgi:hypothetical protein
LQVSFAALRSTYAKSKVAWVIAENVTIEPKRLGADACHACGPVAVGDGELTQVRPSRLVQVDEERIAAAG